MHLLLVLEYTVSQTEYNRVTSEPTTHIITDCSIILSPNN